MADKPHYYITTAISYPNGVPHIGHAYEAIATDAIARFMRLDGYDVFFLTGTDEHGIKMHQTAGKEGLTPRELVERNVPRFQAMVETAQPVERRIHPHHRGASPPRVDRHLGQDGRERRHLSRQVFRLVLGARRGLLRRERDQAERAGRTGRSAGHAGRVGRGGELLLQALGLSGQAAEALRATGLRVAEGAAQRSRRASSRADCGISRSRAPPSTGASRCAAIPST